MNAPEPGAQPLSRGGLLSLPEATVRSWADKSFSLSCFPVCKRQVNTDTLQSCCKDQTRNNVWDVPDA